MVPRQRPGRTPRAAFSLVEQVAVDQLPTRGEHEHLELPHEVALGDEVGAVGEPFGEPKAEVFGLEDVDREQRAYLELLTSHAKVSTHRDPANVSLAVRVVVELGGLLRGDRGNERRGLVDRCQHVRRQRDERDRIQRCEQGASERSAERSNSCKGRSAVRCCWVDEHKASQLRWRAMPLLQLVHHRDGKRCTKRLTDKQHLPPAPINPAIASAVLSEVIKSGTCLQSIFVSPAREFERGGELCILHEWC